MILTVKDLKKALEEVPDDALISSMSFGRNRELQLFTPKRFFIGKSNNGTKLFIINEMGTHWDKEWAEKNDAVEIIKTIDAK